MKKILSIIIFGAVFMSCSKEEKVAVISTQYGEMVLEFYEEVAPMHVESFKTLADEGYFDNTAFHRVIPGFVIQGGDPNSKGDDRMRWGSGGRAGKFFGIGNEKDNKTWKIPAEFNDKKHVKGTLSMARSKDPNSAGSQFFICHAATPQLNNQYTVFGQVIDGLEIIDQIVYSETPRKQNPGYRGPDADYPFEKVEMKIKLVNKSQALK